MKYYLIRCLFIVPILAFMLCGCASFSNINFPDYTYDHIKDPVKKNSVDYDVTTTWDTELANTPGYWNNRLNQLSDEKVRRAFEQSKLFSRYNAGYSEADYLINFSFHIHTPLKDRFFLMSLNVLSATLIPARYRYDFTMTVDVQRGGKLLKRYKYDQRIDAWVQTFLIFVMPFYPSKSYKNQIFDQMLLVFLHDVQQDKLLEASP